MSADFRDSWKRRFLFSERCVAQGAEFFASDCGDFASGGGLSEAVLVAGGDEGEEERVGLEGLGFELGVELAAEEERVGGDLDDLDVGGVGGCAGEAEAAAGEDGLVLAVELVAVAMALGDFGGAVG